MKIITYNNTLLLNKYINLIYNFYNYYINTDILFIVKTVFINNCDV